RPVCRGRGALRCRHRPLRNIGRAGHKFKRRTGKAPLRKAARQHRPAALREQSAQGSGLEGDVGLDDLAQFVLAGAGTARGIGGVAIHQELDPRLDLGPLRVRVETEGVERLAFDVAQRAALPAVAARTPLAAELRVDVERIIGRPEGRLEPGSAGEARLLAVLAELPGGTVTGDRVLLEPGNRLVAHAGEVIVRMIVLAHVLETEAPVLALAQAAFRRAMGGGAVAARPLAHGLVGLEPTVLAGLDPDAIEQW